MAMVATSPRKSLGALFQQCRIRTWWSGTNGSANSWSRNTSLDIPHVVFQRVLGAIVLIQEALNRTQTVMTTAERRFLIAQSLGRRMVCTVVGVKVLKAGRQQHPDIPGVTITRLPLERQMTLVRRLRGLRHRLRDQAPV